MVAPFPTFGVLPSDVLVKENGLNLREESSKVVQRGGSETRLPEFKFQLCRLLLCGLG